MFAPTVADVGMLVWCGSLVSLGQSRFGLVASPLSVLALTQERHPQTFLSSALVG